MSRFSTERDAKEFLVGEIVREAARQGRPLTDIEQKMLYFSESGWTLPNMAEVAETFEQYVDSEKYERKVASLARSAHQHAEKAGAAAWSEAVERLEAGDHYLLVMVGRPGDPRRNAMTWRSAVAVIVLLVGFGAIFPLVLERWLGHLPTQDDMGFFTWAGLVVLAVAYLVIRFVARRDRFDGWLDRALEWFARGPRT